MGVSAGVLYRDPVNDPVTFYPTAVNDLHRSLSLSRSFFFLSGRFYFLGG